MLYIIYLLYCIFIYILLLLFISIGFRYLVIFSLAHFLEMQDVASVD